MKIYKPTLLQIITAIIIILPYMGFFGIYKWYDIKAREIENACFIIISKQEMRLSVYNYKGNELCKFPVACGANFGNKTEKGDMKTPEGVFRVTEIQNSTNWSHDFKDGNGEISGAYGPHFIRLFVPEHSGIGIHGTHNSASIEQRVTEGCIRLKNEDLLTLVKYVHSGMVVVITTSADDANIELKKK